MKIVGFSFSKGTYEGYDYDNIIMHCLDTGGIGSVVSTVKIKKEDFNVVFGDFIAGNYDLDAEAPLDRDVMRELIGCTCRVLYDKRGKYAADVRVTGKAVDEPFERG